MNILSNIIGNEEMQEILRQFSRLNDRCYLENAGSNLYPKLLIEKVAEDLNENFYMNPHTDQYTTDCIEQIRTKILKHFNTDNLNYTVVFTSGATQALKLVTESFQFKNENNYGSFIYLRESHTSVLGLREIAREKKANINHFSHNEFLECLTERNLVKAEKNGNPLGENGNTLVVFPAQSNFNGYKYPKEAVVKVKSGCLNHLLPGARNNVYVLLDAASYVATSNMDLSKIQPDFVALSFYKMFGYPTGLGAILIRNDAVDVLNDKTYFGGGTVDIVLSSADFHVKRKIIHERFEDGTIPFLSIIALKHAYDAINSLVPKVINDNVMDTISQHVFSLASDLYNQLVNLRHANGNKAIILYMDSDFSYIEEQGGIVTFNVIRDDGTFIGYSEFQHMADLFNINIRTGCFCSPGSCQRHLNISDDDMKAMYQAGHKCGDEVDLINGKPTGAVRASFAYYNTFEDVDKLVMMICKCFVKTNFVKPVRHAVLKSCNDKKICEFEINRQEDEEYGGVILKEINIYPIKSCGAFKIRSSWEIGTKGFQYDREWMIIKDNGVGLTQKHNTRMCMIKPVVDLERRVLKLTFKGKDSISIPLDATAIKQRNISLCQSKVCTDTIIGYDCGDEVADWISEALEISYLRLIRQADVDERTLKGDNKMLSLSNQAQYLLINQATVAWLKKQIKDDTFLDSIDQLADRFRGNLIIDAKEELVEREWQTIIIGSHEFKVEGQCTRCQMVCIDQNTGEKTVEPLTTISKLFAGKMRFGIYLSYIGPIHDDTDSLLKVNSKISVNENCVSDVSR